MVERLTERDEYGNANIIGVDSADLQLNLEFDAMNKVTEALNKLAVYEELEEQGKLLKCPCKVGDMVYMISRGRILPLEVSRIDIFLLDGKETTQIECTNDALYGYGYMHFLTNDFGKTVFFTKSAAEHALKETEGVRLQNNMPVHRTVR